MTIRSTCVRRETKDGRREIRRLTSHISHLTFLDQSRLLRATSILAFRTLTLLLLAAASGCGRSPAVNFYTLAAMAPEAASTAAASHSVAVGPVTLPELVDRPQLVIRVAASRVDILETHRWAEPLKNEIPRVLAENLARLLRPARVSTYGQSASRDAEYRVLVDIQRFESVPGDGVTIEALWSVRRTAVGAVPGKGRSIVREPAVGTGYEALVAAHGRALAAISRDIAQALLEEEGHKDTKSRKTGESND